MSLTDSIKEAAEKVKDSVNEVLHKTNASAEHEARDAAGDTLTPSEKLHSIAFEAKENTLGTVDEAKTKI